MRVLMFQDRFAPKVLDGSKTQTIRLTAGCKPGDELSLRRWTGRPYRSKQEVLLDTVCAEVVPVTLSTGHVSSGRVTTGPSDAFARADGFADWADMMAWFAETHGLPVYGFAIRWPEDAAKPAPARALVTCSAAAGCGAAGECMFAAPHAYGSTEGDYKSSFCHDRKPYVAGGVMVYAVAAVAGKVRRDVRQCGHCSLFDADREVKCRVASQIRAGHTLRPISVDMRITGGTDASECRFFHSNKETSP